MNKRKILLISSFASIAPIVVAAKCTPDSDNIVEFRLGIKDLDLKFANYGAVNSKELESKLKQKPLKDGEFTIVYPSQEELNKEAQIIKDFFEKEETKKIPGYQTIYKETYETIVSGKQPVSLSDFTNEYLWSRDLVKIVDNGSIKSKNKLKLIINQFIDNANGSTTAHFRVEHSDDQRIYEVIGDSNGYIVQFKGKLKTISANHYHLTKEIIENNKNNLAVLLKANETTQRK
ncbi:Hypothetical protein, predicted lipoprotein [Mycoplasmopsis agalactiae 14628]|uniref:Lipoprotein n=1 Tax=Mycoplasmopsis agalactiae 14628 TaxID=1110504 RepID=I5D5Q0_MYCAA|nr:variable surface lipoprotein [Mycoplasmopsis agalactiae]EIN15009.1 Hypothetical protein, predicted lipoprotein [Mycoplasmopsis agalactiae 14628]